MTCWPIDAELDKQRAVSNGADPLIFMQLDEAFHRMLAEFAGQREVWNYLEGLKTQMNRVRHISTRQFALDKLISQHAAVVDAVRRGDAGAAETGMRKHLREIISDLPDIVNARPDLFEDADKAS